MRHSEIRRALHGFARNPMWFCAAAATLALGVGANATLFAYVASIVRPVIDAPEPHRLVHFAGSADPADPQSLQTSAPDFRDYYAANDVFSRFCASSTSFSALTRGDGTVFRAVTETVYGEFFELFDARPAAGRLLSAADDDSVVVLGYGFWQKAFQGDRDVVGRSVTLNASRQAIVVGVAAKGFQGSGLEASYYIPAPRHPENPEEDRDFPWLWSMARLLDGVSVEQAQASMTALGRALDEKHPRDPPRRVLVRKAESLVAIPEENPGWETQSKVLMGAVVLFWALVCANVAGLLLARAVERRREVSIRLALGARRSDLARPIIVECLLLALVGGTAGVVLGWAGSRRLNGYLRELTLGFSDLSADVVVFDDRAAFFSFAITLAAALLFGLAPLIDSWKVDLSKGMQSRGGREDRGVGLLRRGLVVGQIAFSVALLIVAGLLGRTLHELRQVDPGFKSENLYLASFYMPRLPDAAPDETYRRIAERIRSLPGVEKVGQTLIPPLSGQIGAGQYDIALNDGAEIKTHRRIVDADYHAALGVDLLAGRTFGSQDVSDSPLVVVVNQVFAESTGASASEDALGRSFLLPWGSRRGERAVVVGVTANTRLLNLHEAPKPTYYFPSAQRARPAPWTVMLIRTSNGAPHPGPATAQILREEFSGVALTDLSPFSEQIRRNVGEQRLSADVTSAVAMLGLILAVVGLTSIMSYSVHCRRRELGVRTALGAAAKSVERMILAEACKTTMLGVLLGILAALLLGRMLHSQLYDLVDAADLSTFVAVFIVMLCAALGGAWIPARRAARIDPASVLREN